ncbi:uncharacterized protein LOC124925308 [Impatiens glandulifera]|uniref:uncharacterized protein LOC124925308 n=1 Tax=Impatiens glandulifera TaxID=253017 RepID=UPI001FB19AA5|nr:uncharacterized protein LOC124925308 [Impatiens glandulifera]
MAACLPIFLLLLTYSFSGILAEGCSGNMNNFHTMMNKVNSRKLMVHDTIMDYDDAGPNSKHDPPRKGKPANGGGAKNP